MPFSTSRRALLVFADPLALDLGRRRWGGALAPLLSPQGRIEGPWAVHWFSRGPRMDERSGVEWHAQRGRDFAERLENAVAELRAAGAEQVVIVGRDCPGLSQADIAEAFARMDEGAALVLGPDHGGGCWLIGLPAGEDGVLAGIAWNRGIDFEMLRRRAGQRGSVAVLVARWDLDSTAALRRAARLEPSLAAFVPALGAMVAWAAALFRPRFDPARHAWRARLQLPPPVVA